VTLLLLQPPRRKCRETVACLFYLLFHRKKRLGSASLDMHLLRRQDCMAGRAISATPWNWSTLAYWFKFALNTASLAQAGLHGGADSKRCALVLVHPAPQPRVRLLQGQLHEPGGQPGGLRHHLQGAGHRLQVGVYDITSKSLELGPLHVSVQAWFLESSKMCQGCAVALRSLTVPCACLSGSAHGHARSDLLVFSCSLLDAAVSAGEVICSLGQAASTCCNPGPYCH
jgi:hypothetical protein